MMKQDEVTTQPSGPRVYSRQAHLDNRDGRMVGENEECNASGGIRERKKKKGNRCL